MESIWTHREFLYLLRHSKSKKWRTILMTSLAQMESTHRIFYCASLRVTYDKYINVVGLTPKQAYSILFEIVNFNYLYHCSLI